MLTICHGYHNKLMMQCGSLCRGPVWGFNTEVQPGPRQQCCSNLAGHEAQRDLLLYLLASPAAGLGGSHGVLPLQKGTTALPRLLPTLFKLVIRFALFKLVIRSAQSSVDKQCAVLLLGWSSGKSHRQQGRAIELTVMWAVALVGKWTAMFVQTFSPRTARHLQGL